MKPLLLIDVGNTRLKWAEASARGAIKPRGHTATRQVNPAWAVALAGKFADRSVIISSVVPAVSRVLRRAFPRAIFVSGTLPGLPLVFHYPRPGEIGADRIAAAVGARVRGAAIIVSCGTATAFSVLDSRGRFCGGAIAPGLATQHRALLGATAQLPGTALLPNPRALGRSSRAAIRAGIVIGHQGAVREIVTRLRQELGTPARLIVTGGEAVHLRGRRGLGRMEFRPLLVFEGLRIIAAAVSGP